jgi:hypothetical protein
VCGKPVEVPNLSRLRRMRPTTTHSQRRRPDGLWGINPEAARNLSSGRGWALVGLGVLLAGVVMSFNGHRVGTCFDLLGLGAILLGALRFVRGMVQRKTDVLPQ